MNFQEWSEALPQEIRQDSLWKMRAYQFALFACDIGWHDVTQLMTDRRTQGIADQLYRSLGSITANLAEGYSKSGHRDRARFYEYALGSAREARDWYYKGRHILKPEVIAHRIQLLTEIVRLLLTMIPQQRRTTLGEPPPVYQLEPSHLLFDIPFA